MLSDVIKLALHEDAPWGDITSRLTVPELATFEAEYKVRQDCIISGVEVIAAVHAQCDASVEVKALAANGDAVQAGTAIASVSGNARSILLAERVSLNLLSHLCGVATLTSIYVDAVRDTDARITDTRKTTPGLRELERQAVRDGGGQNHRFSLSDAVLVKDNHIAAVGGLASLVGLAESTGHLTGLEVEIDSLDQIEDALMTGCDSVLCDNFSLDDLRRAVELVGDAAYVNASGGVTLSTVAEIARTGVDLISVGAITHSAPIIDIGLDSVLQ